MLGSVQFGSVQRDRDGKCFGANCSSEGKVKQNETKSTSGSLSVLKEKSLCILPGHFFSFILAQQNEPPAMSSLTDACRVILQVPMVSSSTVATIVVVVQGENDSMTKKTKILIIPPAFINVIQTDKPIYKPGQTGKRLVEKHPLGRCVAYFDSW